MGIDVYCGDCLDVLRRLPAAKADIVYLDPPFFTQRKQKLSTRDRSTEFSFDDRWESISEYASFLVERLEEFHRVLKPTGTIFFHCDKTASHIARLILDDVYVVSSAALSIDRLLKDLRDEQQTAGNARLAPQ